MLLVSQLHLTRELLYAGINFTPFILWECLPIILASSIEVPQADLEWKEGVILQLKFSCIQRKPDILPFVLPQVSRKAQSRQSIRKHCTGLANKCVAIDLLMHVLLLCF